MAPKGKDAKGKAAVGDKKGKGGDTKDKAAKGAVDAGAQKGAQSISVRHILCEKHSKKEEAIAALNGGRDFADVAREFSEDKARQGGNLGWKTRGSLIKEFEDVAFALPVSKTGSPNWKEVKTGEGYHIVMVEGRK